MIYYVWTEDNSSIATRFGQFILMFPAVWLPDKWKKYTKIFIFTFNEFFFFIMQDISTPGNQNLKIPWHFQVFHDHRNPVEGKF